MAYRLLLLAEWSWRRLDGQKLPPFTRAGVSFKDEVRVEQDDGQVAGLAAKGVNVNKEKRGKIARLICRDPELLTASQEESQIDRQPPPLANIITLGVRNGDEGDDGTNFESRLPPGTKPPFRGSSRPRPSGGPCSCRLSR